MKIEPQIQSSRPATGQRQSRLVRRSPNPLALEQRFMFDGAAVVDVVDTATKPVDIPTTDSGPHLLAIAATDAPGPPHSKVIFSIDMSRSESLYGSMRYGLAL